jgi:DNA processing protein
MGGMSGVGRSGGTGRSDGSGGWSPEDPELLARAAWSLVAEPGDATAGAVVEALGAQVALRWAAWAVGVSPAQAAERLRRLAGETSPAPDHAAPRQGASEPAPLVVARVLARALPRWAPRLAVLDARPALDALAGCGGTLLTPGRPGWPERLDDLGAAGPLCLWVRGDVPLGRLTRRSIAVVGARAATSYGERVAADLATGLVGEGVTVVSGGAFGIDVAAHRTALAADGATVALLAGGVDRPSPEGNRNVLERLLDHGGALVAESPPGTPPTRSRFLQRNRLIAAVTGATVVVEAAWRSGALSTAARAAELLRPVGAVPGPVTSMASAGCHRLLRDGAAVCVTDAGEAVELLGPTSAHGPDGRVGPTGPSGPGGRDRSGRPDRRDLQRRGAAPGAGRHRSDGVPAQVLDALPRRGGVPVDEIARRAGLAEREVSGALGRLELEGAVRQEGGAWWRGGGGATPVERRPR